MINSASSSRDCDVLHVIPYMHPRAGGPPVVVDRMSRKLIERGWSCRVVTTDAYAPSRDRAWTRQYEDGYPLDIFSRGALGNVGVGTDLARALDYLVRHSRLVHMHTLWTYATRLAMRACRRHKVPYVVMPHGMLDPNSLRRGWLKKQLYGRLVEWPGIRRADGMIYTHPLELQLADSAVTRLPPGYVVPLGTDDPPAASRSELAREFLDEFPALRGHTLVTFLSRLHPKKGLDLLIAGFNLLRDRHDGARLVLVGPGEPSYLNQLRRIVEQLSLADRVTFTGPLEGRRKWAALAAARVFALPSYQENFGLVIVEAQRMGVPVVISRQVNIWQEIVSGGGGEVAELTPSGVAAALEPLLSSADMAAEMGARGERFVQDHFSWQVAAETLEGVYRAVLGESTRQDYLPSLGAGHP